MVWKEVTVSCMKGAWHKIWPSNENYGTNCDNLDMLIKEVSEIAEVVGLDNTNPMGITEFQKFSPSHRPVKNFMCWPNN